MDSSYRASWAACSREPRRPLARSFLVRQPHFTRTSVLSALPPFGQDGNALAKKIVHGITTLDGCGTPEVLASLTRGQWRIESLHRIRDTAYAEDANTGYTGDGPQVMATLRNIAISLLHPAGIREITRTLQAISRARSGTFRPPTTFAMSGVLGPES